MSSEDFNILESVVHITSARDIKSLENVLLDALSDMDSFDSLILLSVSDNNKDKYLGLTKSIPQNAYQSKLKLAENFPESPQIERDESINKSITEKTQVVIKSGDGTRILIPVIVNKKVTGILDVYTSCYDENTEKLIKYCVRIYSDFLSVLHDSEHDTLTGLLNRKTFDDRVAGVLSSFSGDRRDLALPIDDRRNSGRKATHWIGMLDIDHFKKINDNFGHVYGDEVLILFADKLRDVFRSSDLLFRFGGEEFIVVLLNALESDAILAFNRFRTRLEQTGFPQVGRVTVSTGMVKANSGSHLTELLDQADQALYYAKKNGRNQVCNYYDLIEAGKLKKKVINDVVELF